jgi:prepilin-type N-terminal cleavage/methylation domain-containing protein
MISPRHCQFDRQRGVTLTELLIVIVIIAIVCSFALMQRGSANSQFQRQNIALQLKTAFERARFDSVKRRATGGNVAKVVLNTGNFTLWTDKNMDGTPASTETDYTDFSGQNIVIAGNGSVTLPFTVYYNLRGEATDSSGNPISPAFYVCNANCTSVNSSNANLVVVTPTGTVNLLGGGSSVPSFPNPSESNVGASANINPLVTLP